MKIEQCNSQLEHRNKQIDRYRHDKKKDVENEKLAKEVVALNAKIQELKDVVAEVTEETIIRLTKEKSTLEAALDKALVISNKNYTKGNQWQTNVTR